MPHIHEKIDFAADAFIVYENKVLLRMHDKYKMWLGVGGHIELDEDPIEAVLREVKEEVGLDVEIFGSLPEFDSPNGERELVPPKFMSRHGTIPGHEHISLVYFARARSSEVVEGENEKSGGWKWFTKEELESGEYEMLPRIRHYALTALKEISS